MVCYHCGQTNRPTAHFCFNCRAPLLLQNKYRVTGQLGRGGFGSVYYAEQLHLGNVPCAIKELIPDPNANAQQLQQAATQFQFEASTLARLSDPTLPRVTDFFNEGNRYYLVMEYVEGETLEERLQRVNAPLPERDVLAWAEVLCDTLTYLHSQNPPVIHRDIKPSNIKITPYARVKLLDFGIAKLLSGTGNTYTAARAVTPPYAPLEQYGKGKGTDARTDVYALGVTLYQLLTNQLPPEAPDRASEPLIPPRHYNPILSIGTELAILKAIAVNPVDRHQNAQEFKRVLQPIATLPKTQPRGIYTTPTVTNPNVSSVGTTRLPRQTPSPNSSNWWIWGAVIALFVIVGLFVLLGNMLRAPLAQPTAAPTLAAILPNSSASQTPRIIIVTATANVTRKSFVFSATLTVSPPTHRANTPTQVQPNPSTFTPTELPLTPSTRILPTTSPIATFATTSPLPTITRVPTKKPVLPTSTPIPQEATADMIVLSDGSREFWVDKKPITNAQFESFVKATGLVTFAEQRGASDVLEPRGGVHSVQGVNWRVPYYTPGSFARPEGPVVQVTKSEAGQFCIWTARRLPTLTEHQITIQSLGYFPYERGEAYSLTVLLEWASDSPSPMKYRNYETEAADFVGFRCATDK